MEEQDKTDVESLSMVEVDVDQLEQRLELAHAHPSPDGYYCFNDCRSFSEPK